MAVPTTHVSLDRFITLFVNHRPVYGIGKNNIEDAFQALIQETGSSANTISRNDFTSLLYQEGEQMNAQELEKHLLQLIGEQNIQVALQNEISSDNFAENILGFEEVDEAELQQDMDTQSMMQQSGLVQ